MGWAIIRTAIIWLIGTTLGRGILRALNSKGYHPETWVGSVIGSIIPAKKTAASIPWILAGIFGLFIVIGWDTFHVTERLERLWPSGPPTLRSLFDDDLNSSGMVIEPTNDMPILINGSRRLVRIKFVFDPVSRGYFFAFLLLQGEVNYETSHWIGENFDAALRPFKIFMGGVITLPGDATGTRIDDLRFTHQVYIYHPSNLTQEKQYELRQWFKQHDLDLTLRGPEYLYNRGLIDRNK